MSKSKARRTIDSSSENKHRSKNRKKGSRTLSDALIAQEGAITLQSSVGGTVGNLASQEDKVGDSGAEEQEKNTEASASSLNLSVKKEDESTSVDLSNDGVRELIQSVLMDYLVDPSGELSTEGVMSFLIKHGLYQPEEQESIKLQAAELFSSHMTVEDGSAFDAIEAFVNEIMIGIPSANESAAENFDEEGDIYGEDATSPVISNSGKVSAGFLQWQVVLPLDENAVMRTGSDLLRKPPVLNMFVQDGESPVASLALNEKTARQMYVHLEEIVSLYEGEKRQPWSFRGFWNWVVDIHQRSRMLRYMNIAVGATVLLLGVYGLLIIAGVL